MLHLSEFRNLNWKCGNNGEQEVKSNIYVREILNNNFWGSLFAIVLQVLGIKMGQNFRPDTKTQETF